ncbi:hypothetical protein [Niallia sp. 03133]
MKRIDLSHRKGAVKVAAIPSENEIEIVNDSINKATGYSLKVMV